MDVLLGDEVCVALMESMCDSRARKACQSGSGMAWAFLRRRSCRIMRAVWGRTLGWRRAKILHSYLWWWVQDADWQVWGMVSQECDGRGLEMGVEIYLGTWLGKEDVMVHMK